MYQGHLLSEKERRYQPFWGFYFEKPVPLHTSTCPVNGFMPVGCVGSPEASGYDQKCELPSTMKGINQGSLSPPSKVASFRWCPLKLPLLEVPRRDMEETLSILREANSQNTIYWFPAIGGLDRWLEGLNFWSIQPWTPQNNQFKLLNTLNKILHQLGWMTPTHWCRSGWILSIHRWGKLTVKTGFQEPTCPKRIDLLTV